MANLSYTFSDLQKAVTHVLGGAPDANTTAAEIVNDAFAYFCGMNQWRWKSAALSVVGVNGQTYIALPADFQEIVTIKKSADTTNLVEPVTLDKIIEARQQGAAVTAGIWYCLSWRAQTGVTLAPTPVLEVYPTPGASPPTLVGIYLRKIPKLSGGTDVPDIPEDYHPILRIFCRAWAVQYETGGRGADWQTFLDMLPMMERLDGRSQGYLGKLRGGLRGAMGPSLQSQTTGISA